MHVWVYVLYSFGHVETLYMCTHVNIFIYAKNTHTLLNNIIEGSFFNVHTVGSIWGANLSSVSKVIIFDWSTKWHNPYFRRIFLIKIDEVIYRLVSP